MGLAGALGTVVAVEGAPTDGDVFGGVVAVVTALVADVVEVVRAAAAEVVAVTVDVVGVEHVGAVMVSVVVETVPPNAKALPDQVIVLPMVIPEASMSVPRNVEFAPSVVAAIGVHQISHADAPLANRTAELATEVSAPWTRKMYVPLPVNVMPAVPIDAALDAAVQ
jgi:hypothetical protein